MIRIFTLLLLLLTTSCSKDNIDIDKYHNLDYELDCIWDKSRHCAFTSLIEYNGKYYCSFREADSHIPDSSDSYGKIRILESVNGNNWHSIALIEDNEFDLRDPNLSVTPDNRLMLICGGSRLDDNNTLSFNHTRVYFYNIVGYDNHLNIDKYMLNIDDEYHKYWIWKVVWHNGVAYGVAYNNIDAPLLVMSSDGINFTSITTLNILGNEADIEFVDNDMLIVSRSIKPVEKGYLGSSSYPYIDWHWANLDHLVQSPELINVNDNIILSGRGEFGTTLYRVDNNISPILTLPSDGDAGYPGMIYDKHEDRLWISYYTTVSTTKIYMAKLYISDIL